MKRTLLFFALTFLLAGCNSVPGQKSVSADDLDTIVIRTIDACTAKLKLAAAEVADSLSYPSYGLKDGREPHWRTVSSKNWVSGFWPGCLWYGYALTGDPEMERLAKRWTAGIEQEKFNTGTHDLGFRFMCTFGKGMIFDEELAVAYKPVILQAAQTLSGLYHPEFGALCSDWDSAEAKKRLPDSTPCVIDIMMNLEILFWASRNGGDPALYDKCISHAQTTWRDFVREDGGTYHVVRYDKKTGAILEKNQIQGDVQESTWSRGHSWLVYGLVVCYRFTHDEVWLSRAKKAADYFIRNLNSDGIANWDFQSSENYTDASASAVVCSALYEMTSFLPEGREKAYYKAQADRMLSALCSPDYFCTAGSPCLLDHSVRFFHSHAKSDDMTQDPNLDEPCSFADYYFMEALYRYKNL